LLTKAKHAEYAAKDRIVRLSKNNIRSDDDRAAGELEGARPASSTINRRPERLDFSRLSG